MLQPKQLVMVTLYKRHTMTHTQHFVLLPKHSTMLLLSQTFSPPFSVLRRTNLWRWIHWKQAPLPIPGRTPNPKVVMVPQLLATTVLQPKVKNHMVLKDKVPLSTLTLHLIWKTKLDICSSKCSHSTPILKLLMQRFWNSQSVLMLGKLLKISKHQLYHQLAFLRTVLPPSKLLSPLLPLLLLLSLSTETDAKDSPSIF